MVVPFVLFSSGNSVGFYTVIMKLIFLVDVYELMNYYWLIAAKQAADANAAAWAAYYSHYYSGQQNQNTQNSGPPTSQPQPNASQPPSGPQAGR